MSVTFVHSDLRHFLRDHRGSNRQLVLDQVVSDIRTEAQGDLWMPTFNYGFCRGEDFIVGESRSECGVLSEHFRLHLSDWRTNVPIFSVAGEGQMPQVESEGPLILPYGPHSVFEALVAVGGEVLMASCTLGFLNLAHYAEVAGGVEVLYRYDKDFAGTIEHQDGSRHSVVTRYHVTPLANRVLYDWAKIDALMSAAGVVRSINKWGQSSLVDAKGFVLLWQKMSSDDPFWPLVEPSRRWVEPMCERLGRGFRRSDFEETVGE